MEEYKPGFLLYIAVRCLITGTALTMVVTTCKAVVISQSSKPKAASVYPSQSYSNQRLQNRPAQTVVKRLNRYQ